MRPSVLTNSCASPDYQTNLTGTCKHIEGVLLHLKGTLGDRWDELAVEAPPVNPQFLRYPKREPPQALAQGDQSLPKT